MERRSGRRIATAYPGVVQRYLTERGIEAEVVRLDGAVENAVRLGVADLIPNAELSLSRTDGRSTVRAGAFHRLAVANDDWGNPLTLGASLGAALYGRDEGLYYRTYGLELGGTRPAPFGARGGWNPLRGATLGWRLFGERQRGASVEVRSGALGPAFAPNVAGDRALSLGASGELAGQAGALREKAGGFLKQIRAA